MPTIVTACVMIPSLTSPRNAPFRTVGSNFVTTWLRNISSWSNELRDKMHFVTSVCVKRYIDRHKHMSRSYTSKSRSDRSSRTCPGHEPICHEHPTPPSGHCRRHFVPTSTSRSESPWVSEPSLDLQVQPSQCSGFVRPDVLQVFSARFTPMLLKIVTNLKSIFIFFLFRVS